MITMFNKAGTNYKYILLTLLNSLKHLVYVRPTFGIDLYDHRLISFWTIIIGPCSIREITSWTFLKASRPPTVYQ